MIPQGVIGILPTNPATQVSAGVSHTCATLADGTVSCWGRNNYRRLGDGTTSDRTPPVSVVGLL